MVANALRLGDDLVPPQPIDVASSVDLPSRATLVDLTVESEQLNFAEEEPFENTSGDVIRVSGPCAQEKSDLNSTHENGDSQEEVVDESFGALDWCVILESDSILPFLKPNGPRRWYDQNDPGIQIDQLISGYRKYRVRLRENIGASDWLTFQAIQVRAESLDERNEFGKAESLYHEAIEGFERLNELTDQLNCQHALGNILRKTGRTEEAVRLLQSTLFEYKRANLVPGVLSVMSSLMELYIKLKQLDDLRSIMSDMKNLFDDDFVILLPEVLDNGISLAHRYSVLNDFAAAHSVFSYVLPMLWTNTSFWEESDPNYDLWITCGYWCFGLHYMRQGLWTEAVDYLLLAQEELVNKDKYNRSVVVQSHLTEAQMKMREGNHSGVESRKRSELEAIEMCRIHRLLKEIRPTRVRKTTVKDGAEIEDFMTDTTSCKYGITYSVTEITGISDSVFMVP
jgi:tetratricopeptide (TPR) repeat protein